MAAQISEYYLKQNQNSSKILQKLQTWKVHKNKTKNSLRINSYQILKTDSITKITKKKAYLCKVMMN